MGRSNRALSMLGAGGDVLRGSSAGLKSSSSSCLGSPQAASLPTGHQSQSHGYLLPTGKSPATCLGSGGEPRAA